MKRVRIILHHRAGDTVMVMLVTLEEERFLRQVAECSRILVRELEVDTPVMYIEEAVNEADRRAGTDVD